MTSQTPHISAMTPSELAAFEANIVSTCTEHTRVHWQDKEYRRCVVIEQNYFVKFDYYETLWPEVATQNYIYRHAKSDASAPRVPEILHFFQREKTGYAVMEFINLTPPPDLETAAKNVAAALVWLSKVPAPPGHVGIGPLGNGRARHKLFKDNRAPLSFSGIEALQRYLDKALARRCRLAPPVEPVRISHERLIFTQSDMDPSNFGVDNEGKMILLDFGDVGLLPESFALHTMSSSAIFTAAVAKHLDWPPSSNLYLMAVISALLWMTGDDTLGLGKDGNPRR